MSHFVTFDRYSASRRQTHQDARGGAGEKTGHFGAARALRRFCNARALRGSREEFAPGKFLPGFWIGGGI